jgi:Tol biopolymer transport system component
MLAGAALVALAALAFVHFRETPPVGKVITAAILPPNNAPGDATTRWQEISPDGRRIVFALRSGNKSQLWLRPLDSSTAQALPGTEGGFDPFWSPDSRSIAFFADQKLKRMDLPDGAPITLADAPLGYGGSWGQTGVIVFAPAAFRGLARIPAAGGAPVAMALGQGARYPSGPWFLPDGRHFLLLDLGDTASHHGILKISSLDSTEVKTIGPADSNAVYGNGRILFLRGTTLIAQAFDERRLDVVQEASPVAQNVSEFSVSRDGTLVYQGGTADVQQLTWLERKGTVAGTLGDPANFYTFDFSPDRKRVALSMEEDLWIQDVARGLRSRFTFAPGVDTNPVWSPDGHSIAFCSNRSGRYGIYRKSADLSGAEKTLYLDVTDTLTDGWSPDGKFLMVHRRDPVNQEDLALLPVTPDAPGGALKLAPFLTTPFRELHGRFSPDGRWVAYLSSESGHSEIYVTSFPGHAGKQQISNTGGSQPRWRADGKELFFVSGSGVLMSAEVAIQGNAVEVGAVRALGIPVVEGRGWMYDVSADGQRFLVAVRPEQKAAPLTLVSNWPLLLKK